MSPYHRSRVGSLVVRGMLALVAVLVSGCTTLDVGGGSSQEAERGPSQVAECPQAPKESPVESHIGFMKRAASAHGESRRRMASEIDRTLESSPMAARLQRGFLLTSPTESAANAREGERILREMLAGRSDLHPAVRDLIELRLQEVEVRQALRVELAEAKGKIEDLLSIESSMEQQKTESQDRTRQ